MSELFVPDQPTVYTASVTLFLVMDSLGNVPIFLSILNHVDPKRRRQIIIREMLIALLFLLGFLFLGKYILEAMQLNPAALSIAGGVILFIISLNMIFPSEHNKFAKQQSEPFIVPMAVPLVAGPTTMAMLMLFGNAYPGEMDTWFVALLIAWLASSIILVSSEFLRKLLTDKGLMAVERLMGILLITMAIQMGFNGAKNFFTTAPTPPAVVAMVTKA